MKLFGKLMKSKATDLLADDPVILTISSTDQIDPDTLNAAKQKLTTEPDLEQTLPRLNLKQANILFQQIFELQVAPNAKPFVLQQVVVQRTDNGDEFTIHDFAIGINYQNMTKIVVDALFNEPELEDTEYRDKVEFADYFNHSFESQLGVSNQNVAQIPSESDVEKGKVSTTVPALSLGNGLNRQASKQSNEMSLPKSPFSNRPSNTELSRSSKTKTASSKSTKVPQPLDSGVSREVRNADKAQAKAMTLAEEVDSQVQTNYAISFPKFDVDDQMASVPPESEKYVAYRQNQKKIEFNKFLREKEIKLNAQLKRDVLSLRQQQQDYLNTQLAEFLKQHDGRDQIHNQVLSTMKIAFKKALQEKEEQLNHDRDQKISAENKRHDDALTQIKNEAQQNMTVAKKTITEDITTETNKKIDAELAKQTAQLETSQRDFAADLEKAQETDVEDLALNGQTKGTDYGSQLFKQLTETLDQFSTQLVNEHSNANESMAAKQRAENNGKDIDAKFKENTMLSKENRELRAKDAANADELERLKNEVSELKSKDHSSDISKLILAQNNAKKSPEQEQLASLMQLAIAERLGNTKSPETSSKSQANPSSSLKNMLIAGLAGVVLLVGGGTGIIVHSNDQSNLRMEKIEAKQNSEHSRNSELSTRMKQETSKRTTAESQASDFEAKYEDQNESLTKANKRIQKLEKQVTANSSNNSSSKEDSNDAK